MGMAVFILAGEGDLYDINEYHMLAHLIRYSAIHGLYGTNVSLVWLLSCMSFFSSVTILKCTFQYDANSGHGLEGACGDDINLPVALMYSASSDFTVS